MKKILIIDDNKDILYALSEILSYKNWLSLTATNVEEGIDLFKANAIDLVIMDYHMPIVNGMLGVKLLRTISADVPIIVLTVEENQEIADAFINAGASDFALKPIKAPDLLARITVHLNATIKQKEKQLFEDKYKDYTKGISITTLEIIEAFMSQRDVALSISEISKSTGLAYQTIHRYMQYLQEYDIVGLEQDYGKVGRPRQNYKWIKE